MCQLFRLLRPLGLHGAEILGSAHLRILDDGPERFAKAGSLTEDSRFRVSRNIPFRQKPIRTISGFLELISRFEFEFCRRGNYFLKDSNFWCVHVHVLWPVCTHAIPFRMLWLPRFMMTEIYISMKPLWKVENIYMCAFTYIFTYTFTYTYTYT